MDSILSDSKSTRDYFFPVFVKILERTDGAVTEMISYYTFYYIVRFPKEYIDRINTGGIKRFEWEDNAIWGLSGEISINRLPSEKAFSDSVITNCQGCDSSTLAQLAKTISNMNTLAAEEL